MGSAHKFFHPLASLRGSKRILSVLSSDWLFQGRNCLRTFLLSLPPRNFHIWHVPPSQGTNFIRALPVQSPQKVVFTVAFCANLGARLAHAKLKRSKLAP